MKWMLKFAVCLGGALALLWLLAGCGGTIKKLVIPIPRPDLAPAIHGIHIPRRI